MKYTIYDQVVLSREPEGPLAAYLSSFANAIGAQGYCAQSMKQQVRIAACFSRWLKQRGVGVRDICFDHATRYLRYRARHVRPRSDDRAALRHLIDFLREEGVIPPEQMETIRISAAELVYRSTRSTYAIFVLSPEPRSFTTCRSSASFSNIVSATGGSRYRDYVRPMS